MAGVKLQDLLEETDQVAVRVGASSVALSYRVLWEEHFDAETWERLKPLRGRAYFAEILPRMLVSWELQDATGQPIPVTAEAIAEHQVPVRFLRMVESAVLDDRGKGGAASETSPAGSTPRAA